MESNLPPYIIDEKNGLTVHEDNPSATHSFGIIKCKGKKIPFQSQIIYHLVLWQGLQYYFYAAI